MQPTIPAAIEVPESARPCPSCGAVALNAYCGECGAEQGRPPNLSLRSFARTIVRELTALDSRLLATLHSLLLRPGLLTREYVAGRGGRFLSPLRTFFLANVVYFVAQSLFLPSNTFTTTLTSQLATVPARRLKSELVARKSAQEGAPSTLATRWNAVAVEHGKTLVVLLIPIYAAFLALGLVHRRRPIVQHMVFATHFVAFLLLILLPFTLTMMLAYLLARTAAFNLGWLGTDWGSSSVLAVVLVAYLVPALRRGYDVGRGASFVLAPLLVIGLLVALQFYRFALFFTVYLAM